MANICKYINPGIPTTIKTMGVNITTIVYLRVLIIEIGSTIILMVVEAQGKYPIVDKVLHVSTGAGFLPSIVVGCCCSLTNYCLHEWFKLILLIYNP